MMEHSITLYINFSQMRCHTAHKHMIFSEFRLPSLIIKQTPFTTEISSGAKTLQLANLTFPQLLVCGIAISCGGKF